MEEFRQADYDGPLEEAFARAVWALDMLLEELKRHDESWHPVRLHSEDDSANGFSVLGAASDTLDDLSHRARMAGL